MSDGRSGDDRPDGRGDGDGDVERRLTDAMASFGAGVHPDRGAWERIDERLDDRAARRVLDPTSRGRGSGRPMLAAAAVVLVVLAGAVAVRARSGDEAQQLMTAPTDGAVEIAAVTEDGRLVGLDIDGIERRAYYSPPPDRVGAAGSLRGPITVDPIGRTVYAERTTDVLCGDVAGAYAVGEIVAIPLDGGEAEVVAPIGRVPAYDPTRNLLAYTLPTSRQACSPPTDASSVVITDLATRAAAQIPLQTEPHPDSDLSDWAIDIEWSVGDDQLLVLADQGRDLTRFSVGPSIGELSLVDRLPLWIVEPTDDEFGIDAPTPGPGEAPVAVLLGESIEPMASPPDGDAAGETFVVSSARHSQSWVDPVGAASVPTGGVRVVEQTIHPANPANPDDVLRTSSGPATVIAPASLGTGPLWRSQIDRNPATGATLISLSALLDDRVPDPPPADAMEIQFSRTAVPSVSLLLVQDASGVHRIADGVVAAAWVRMDDPDPIDPAGTTSTTAPPTTFPPEPGTTSTTAPVTRTIPSSTQVPAGDLIDGSERPDDAAAIVDAYRSFFEQGDRSALEDSGILEPAFEEGQKTVPGGGQGVTVTIDAISFLGPEEAEVRFRLDKDGNYFTAATVGGAVFVDGRWKVSAATMCTLLSRVDIPCPTAG